MDKDGDAHIEAWAQLISVTDLDTSFIPIKKNKFVIGRNSDCDLPHPGNNLISGRHCYIERDDQGKVWLYDSSTNGTLLNHCIKLCKGERRELHHGDEIHIVHKKNATHGDIGYMFQEMEALRAETSSDTDDTQEYTVPQADLTIEDDALNEGSSLLPLWKRKSMEIFPISCKKSKSDSLPDVTISTTGKPRTAEDNPKDVARDKSEMTDKTDDTLGADSERKSLGAEPEEDAIAESLMCIICQELLHDCISLQPCMHSFCGGCYSEWMERSNECPSCRVKVERINKNHIVNNLVEAYLKVKPERMRPEEDIQALDTKNKITREMLYPAKKETDADDEDSEENCDEDETDDQGDHFSQGPFNGPVGLLNNTNNFFNQGGMVFGIGTPFFGTAINRAAQPVCRQCPNFVDTSSLGQPVGASTAIPTRGAVGGMGLAASTSTLTAALSGPSGSGSDNPGAKILPTAPNFTCAPNGNHVLCLCCMQPMPDRRKNNQIPPQQCGICYRAYCHAYWGCRKLECNGCLGKFKDMNFGEKCLASLILNNAYESEIFKNYMETKGLSVNDVLAACLAKMVLGEYVCTNQAVLSANDGINTPVCYECGLRNFRDLAYNYMRDIPLGELPAEVKNRTNCYWGRHCHTQRNKPNHARRFNHICEQTRTS
ncbi:unnamed protein product [Lymnaea stagnalis]|uniref:E3 ubiquitin-protein ligase CHFR n=1 Tax=Lymnaea stagnalis TaxID=6523 RepID=A0AAV2HMX9_LYMST